MSVDIIQKYNLETYKLRKPQKEDLHELFKACQKNLSEEDKLTIIKAFKLCYLSHRRIKRASGEPYYYHPVEVAKIVAKKINMDVTSVVAALLHDTIEDTDVEIDDIRHWFGSEVASLINGVTKITGVFETRDAKQAETFMKLMLSMVEDMRVILIKFADRLHNMRTIKYLARDKQIQISSETMDLYAPLAHRFGLFAIKNELEDLCFKTIDPVSYKYVARKLREKKEDREAVIDELMMPVGRELAKLKVKFEIKGRPKHIYSIYRKMQRQQKPFEEIYDLFAIRIILEEPHTKEDCWRVYSIITDSYTPIPERFRDFISVPKVNGYQSLHTTVITNKGMKVEFQIRTRKMDIIAEEGLAAHWKYKEGDQDGSKTLDRLISWVREALDNPKPDSTSDFVKDFQLNLYQEEIYVFTPNGELKTLPSNASPIDFAFEIHSEIGERAMAAKVNGRMVPLRHKLKNGDQVEIITGSKINLNPDWIEDVVTHKAKSRIRQFINHKKRSIADEGRKIWNKRARKEKLELSEQEISKVARLFNYDSVQSLFYNLFTGSVDINKVFKYARNLKLTGKVELESSASISNEVDTKSIQKKYLKELRTSSKSNAIILDGGINQLKFTYANCCNPIPGDEVLGFISRNGDVKIHRAMCNNAKHLLKNENDRIVDVRWAKSVQTNFLGAIRIIGEDRVGMINDITDVLSKSLSTNMKSINVTSDEGMFEGIITLDVDGIVHLEKIMKRLVRLQGVKNVLRYE
ncbi:MAG: bifunctional (p)ppGpp synthetase/guanosine-3',5'-bis(diphosphate) 3'-pyrophosphohydrolase [Bacteroidetes bacterium]|nr:bifunctional (p)ppGpp synthetase/guanosine-3',5'-bis(diphosphate) 3'-pyrophosphohydrolase [Bacteroidota bacterium]